jgi:hypothetical protein
MTRLASPAGRTARMRMLPPQVSQTNGASTEQADRVRCNVVGREVLHAG